MSLFIRSFLAFAIIIVLLTSFSLPDRSIPKNQSQDHIRIATANIRYINDSSLQATQLLGKLDIDLLIIIEWTGQNLVESILAENGFVKAACKPRVGTHGICVFHQTDIEIQSSIEPTPIDGPCRIPFATIRILNGDKSIGIQAIHAPPPIPSCKNTTEATLNYHASIIDKGLINQTTGILKEGDEAVVLGDFNAFPFSKHVRQLVNSGMVDAYTSTRTALGPTWSPLRFLPSLARIDYIWVSSKIDPIASWTMNIPGSDHRLVIADIKY